MLLPVPIKGEMLKTKKFVRLVALPVAISFVAASCGSDAKPSTAVSAEGALKGVCPDTIVIQTDWFPEADHGMMYNLIGDDYKIDTEKKTVSGTLTNHDGKSAGVQIEVRTGGPAIGFNPVETTMYTDTSITIGYTSLDAAATSYKNAPTLSIVAPSEKNPQIIMWDPATYPDVKTIADLGKTDAKINVFAGAAYTAVLVGQGILKADQIDESYDGSPARFIAEGGKIAQQGFATAEPYSYKNEFKDWGKDVAYQTVHDAGFEVYTQPLGIRKAEKEKLAPCLKLFVPMVQQSIIDYDASPTRANKMIVDAVAQFKDFWVYGDGNAANGAAQMKALGIVGNGPDKTVGNFDEARVQKAIDQMIAVKLAPADLKAADITTNEFIDPSIGF